MLETINQSAVTQSSTTHEDTVLHQELGNIPLDTPNQSKKHHAPRLKEIQSKHV
jgi:hypothetical protein